MKETSKTPIRDSAVEWSALGVLTHLAMMCLSLIAVQISIEPGIAPGRQFGILGCLTACFLLNLVARKYGDVLRGAAGILAILTLIGLFFMGATKTFLPPRQIWIVPAAVMMLTALQLRGPRDYGVMMILVGLGFLIGVKLNGPPPSGLLFALGGTGLFFLAASHTWQLQTSPATPKGTRCLPIFLAGVLMGILAILLWVNLAEWLPRPRLAGVRMTVLEDLAEKPIRAHLPPALKTISAGKSKKKDAHTDQKRSFTPEPVLDLRTWPPPDDTTVLFVAEVDAPTLWLTRTFDRYDKGRWQISRRDTSLQSFPDMFVDRPERRLVRVRIVESMGTLLPRPPARLEAAHLDRTLFGDGLGNLYVDPPLDSGDHYSLGLIDGAGNDKPSRSDLIVPGRLKSRLRKLAAQWTAGLRKPEDKVARLTQRLMNYAIYDLSVPVGGDEPVRLFLARRKGWCVHFASAMTLLARSSGVPARLACGYGPGRKEALTGRFLIRVADAHAWTRVWLDGKGWVDVDATPPTPENERGSPSPTTKPRLLFATLTETTSQPLVLGFSVAVACLILLWIYERSIRSLQKGVGWIRWRFQTRVPPLGEPVTTIEACYISLTAFLTRHDIPPHPAESPLEYGKRLSDVLPALKRPIATLTAMITATRYADTSPTSGQAEQARKLYLHIRTIFPYEKKRA